MLIDSRNLLAPNIHLTRWFCLSFPFVFFFWFKLLLVVFGAVSLSKTLFFGAKWHMTEERDTSRKCHSQLRRMTLWCWVTLDKKQSIKKHLCYVGRIQVQLQRINFFRPVPKTGTVRNKNFLQKYFLQFKRKKKACNPF